MAEVSQELVTGLQRLIGNASDDDLIDDGRYFSESCSDLTTCYHGDTGRFNNSDDGKLVALLWNNRKLIHASLARLLSQGSV